MTSKPDLEVDLQDTLLDAVSGAERHHCSWGCSLLQRRINVNVDRALGCVTKEKLVLSGWS